MLKGLRISGYGERRMVGPRIYRRRYGVPPGGAFDRESAALSRALLALSEDEPVLEITLGPVRLEATEPVLLSVVGGPDGTFSLAVGDYLTIAPVGARAYVALAQTDSKLKLPRRLAHPTRPSAEPLRVLAGPQSVLLNLNEFLFQTYRVGLASNRVGVRLEGLDLLHQLDLPSDPATPGTIQVPPNGQPIILGPDGPTIGGYPKIAVVIDADFDRVARFRPGDSVRFSLVSPEQAWRIAMEARENLEKVTAELRIGS